MSKVGKKPIPIPLGTTLEVKAQAVHAKGPKGTIEVPVLPFCSVDVKEGKASVSIVGEERQARANWGTMAALIRNAVSGVTAGFERKLQLEGIGYKASVEGDTVVLALGFSHPVRYPLPKGTKAEVQKNIITVTGISKELVGKAVSEIRKFKKPEPYQGKGIRYVGEIVRRKAGKKAAASAK